MNIISFEAKEAFDAYGYTTISCNVVLEDGTCVSSKVPSFFIMQSSNDYEKIISKTIEIISTVFAPVLVNRVPDIKLMDLIISELNNVNGSKLINPAIEFLLSITICKAQAIIHECEIFELIASLIKNNTVSLPFPLIPIFDDLLLPGNYSYPFKKIFLMPLGAPDFKSSCKYFFKVMEEVKALILNTTEHMCISSNGAISMKVDSLIMPFDLISKALKKTEMNEFFVFAVECNIENFYNQKNENYLIGGKIYTSQDLCDMYKNLSDKYPLFSLEDCCSRNDKNGWILIKELFGDTLQLVGNQLFDIKNVVENSLDQEMKNNDIIFANSFVLNPYKIGTLTENFTIIQSCKNIGSNIIITHSIPETEDTFIADFAVGVSSGQIKAGGFNRSEYVAKYNRLLEIEDTLISYTFDQID